MRLIGLACVCPPCSSRRAASARRAVRGRAASRRANGVARGPSGTQACSTATAELPPWRNARNPPPHSFYDGAWGKSGTRMHGCGGHSISKLFIFTICWCRTLTASASMTSCVRFIPVCTFATPGRRGPGGRKGGNRCAPLSGRDRVDLGFPFVSPCPSTFTLLEI